MANRVEPDQRPAPHGVHEPQPCDNLRGVSLVKELDYHASGVLSISNLDVLVTDLELDRNALIDDNLAFIDEEGCWVLPWRLSETIMRRITEKHADILLERVSLMG